MIDLSESAIAAQFAKFGMEMRPEQRAILAEIRDAVKNHRHYAVRPYERKKGQTTLFAMINHANPNEAIMVYKVGNKYRDRKEAYGVPVYNPNHVAFTEELYNRYTLALADIGGATTSDTLKMRTRLAKRNATVFIS